MFEIVSGSALIVSTGLIGYAFGSYMSKRHKIKNWKVGDIAMLRKLGTDVTFRACSCHPLGQPMVIILGWSYKEVYVSFYNGEKWYIKLKNIENISEEVRSKENRVSAHMTGLYSEDPIVKEGLAEQNNRSIAQLEELLDKATIEENFEAAAKLRDEIKKLSENQQVKK